MTSRKSKYGDIQHKRALGTALFGVDVAANETDMLLKFVTVLSDQGIKIDNYKPLEEYSNRELKGLLRREIWRLANANETNFDKLNKINDGMDVLVRASLTGAPRNKPDSSPAPGM